jgi:hypothetical protein
MTDPSGLIHYSKEILTLGDLFEERSVVYARALDKNAPTGDPTVTDTVSSATDLSSKAFSHPTTGMKDLDDIIEATFRLVGILHHMIADAMYNHGSKLVAAYQNMQVADMKSKDDILQSAGRQGITAQDPSGIDPRRPSPYKETREPLTRPPSFAAGNQQSVPIDSYAAPINLRKPSIGRSDPLPSTTENFLKVNYTGLQELAGRLYTFVSDTDSPVTVPLRDAVERVVSDDADPSGTHTAPDGTKWLGTAAQTFRRMFRLDVGTMNGLNCVLCSTAQILDNLAGNLASAEKVLETDLRAQLKGLSLYAYLNTVSESDPSKDLRFDYGYFTWKLSESPNGVLAQMGLPGAAVVTEILRGELDSTLTAALKWANKLRRRAAVELAGVNDIIEESFDRYASSSSKTQPSTDGPDTALTQAQARTLGTMADAQRKSLKSSYARLDVGGDPRAAMDELKKLGGDAAMLAGVLSSAGSLTGKKSLTKGSSALDGLGNALPILAMIGLELL